MKDETLSIPIENAYIEWQLGLLNSKLSASFTEEAEIIETGFSFSSSLKDISRFIIVNLIEQFQNDISMVMNVIGNWERFVKALDNPNLITPEEQLIFDIFTNIYYESIDYFKKQFLTHLGEKVEFESEFLEDPKVQRFVESTGFRQRKFTYSIEQSGSNSIQIITASTSRIYEIKQNEREKVELLNSLLLRFILRPFEAEALVTSTLIKFPDLENELFELLNKAQELVLFPGDHIIEISPPFENYSYQHDCMVRIYTYTGNSFEVLQYSIPYNKREVELAIQNLLLSFNAQNFSACAANEHSSNNILGSLHIAHCTSSNIYLNSFSSILEYGGVEILEKASAVISPKVEAVGNFVHPFIVEYINSPNFSMDSDGLRHFTNRYSEIFLTAIATLDVNVHTQNPNIESILESGELLFTAVAGQNTSNLLARASNGQVNRLEVSANGYCDTVSGTIGASTLNDKSSFTSKEVEAMKFEGRVTRLSKEGDLKLDLMKFIDDNGTEKKLFICPVCNSKGIVNYVDICAESCPQCKVSLTDLRVASQEKNLSTFVDKYTSGIQSKNNSGNGIFGVLFDLFGAIFNVFN